ncbi:hypothetical protein ABNG03_15145 [Halorubrum sp. RMP-47]|uniref:Uncharacterized protein n=1 Tax=Halorubrum miltondacostae TaxID=3076378 RepID=A0ABD5LYQ2_9EURY
MRSDEPPTRPDASTPPFGPPPTARGTALLFGLFAVLPIAASYPAPSAGFAAGVLAARCGVRPFARRLRDWTVGRRPGPVCVPGTNVCLDG